jgi:hypothetical protein
MAPKDQVDRVEHHIHEMATKQALGQCQIQLENKIKRLEMNAVRKEQELRDLSKPIEDLDRKVSLCASKVGWKITMVSLHFFL